MEYNRTLVVIVILAAIGVGCDRIETFLGRGRNLGGTIQALKGADRMVIKNRMRDEVVKDSSDKADLQAVVDLFEKYDTGWVMFSGAGGDYDFFFYNGFELVGRTGITATSRRDPGEDTLNVGDAFRRVPASETSALARRLGLVWPLS